MVERWLVCFAVRDEARHFQPPPGVHCEVLITGIGARNAERSFLDAIHSQNPVADVSPLKHSGEENGADVHRRLRAGTSASASPPPVADVSPLKLPESSTRHATAAFAAPSNSSRRAPLFVLTCGYAGGLDPDLKPGQVVFDADLETGLATRLRELGALPVTFHCHSSIAVTAGDKRALRERTGADAVEMESGVIRRLCRERGIPSATVRVISDDAGADLPLDFNRLAREDGNISYGKLAGALVRAPGKVRALLRFQRELDLAGRHLAATLSALLSGPGS